MGKHIRIVNEKLEVGAYFDTDCVFWLSNTPILWYIWNSFFYLGKFCSFSILFLSLHCAFKTKSSNNCSFLFFMQTNSVMGSSKTHMTNDFIDIVFSTTQQNKLYNLYLKFRTCKVRKTSFTHKLKFLYLKFVYLMENVANLKVLLRNNFVHQVYG